MRSGRRLGRCGSQGSEHEQVGESHAEHQITTRYSKILILKLLNVCNVNVNLDPLGHRYITSQKRQTWECPTLLIHNEMDSYLMYYFPAVIRFRRIEIFHCPPPHFLYNQAGISTSIALGLPRITRLNVFPAFLPRSSAT